MKEINVINLEDRVPKLKEQKRKKANLRLMMMIGFFFFLLMFVIFFQSSLGKISKVEISGNNYIDTNRILDITHLNEKPNYFSVSADNLITLLEKQDEIKDAKVEKKFPNKVRITIKEEKTVAYLKEKGQLAPVLGNGVILSTKHMKEEWVEGPIIEGLKAKNPEFNELVQELNELSVGIISSISEIHYLPSEDKLSELLLYMNEKFIVKTTIHDFSKKMKYYPSIIKKLDRTKKGTIYLDVGAYFEPNEILKEDDDSTNDETVE